MKAGGVTASRRPFHSRLSLIQYKRARNDTSRLGEIRLAVSEIFASNNAAQP